MNEPCCFNFKFKLTKALKKDFNPNTIKWDTREQGLRFRYFSRDMQKIPSTLLLLYCCFTSKVMSGRSVNLTTLFLGRLRPPTSCTSLASN